MRVYHTAISCIVLSTLVMICSAQITFRFDSEVVYLRHGGQDIINLSAAMKVDVDQGEWFQYFGNFIIVRRANNAFKKIINHLNRLGLSFDGVNVEIVTSTIQRTNGPGALYFDESDGVAFYTTSDTLIQRITDALNTPGDLPTPPPNEGDWSNWNSWSSCSVTCGSGFRTRSRQCEGCRQNCCVCPTGEQFQIEECHQLSCEGEWGQWNSWSSCSHICGGGYRTRTRECQGPGDCFPGKSFQSRGCNSHECCSS